MILIHLRATVCHSVNTYHPTQVGSTLPYSHPERPILDLLIQEGWKAELTLVRGFIYREVHRLSSMQLVTT